MSEVRPTLRAADDTVRAEGLARPYDLPHLHCQQHPAPSPASATTSPAGQTSSAPSAASAPTAAQDPHRRRTANHDRPPICSVIYLCSEIAL